MPHLDLTFKDNLTMSWEATVQGQLDHELGGHSSGSGAQGLREEYSPTSNTPYTPPPTTLGLGAPEMLFISEVCTVLFGVLEE